MRYGRLAGLDKDISLMILGCDTKMTAAEGAPLWDAFLAAGGTAFDTAHIYGNGVCEAALGGWIGQRGVTADIVVTVKGAHAPGATPITWCGSCTNPSAGSGSMPPTSTSCTATTPTSPPASSSTC